MECYYTFNVESYYTMSKACYDCPFNVTDCFRPHCIPADGVKRSILVVNRQLPGPPIEVCQGDKIIVDVINLLASESTTMHWHGQHQKETPYMDGVPFVSQCPISPGTSFRYEFHATESGTHFWHSHSGLQRGDGLFGPLIVRSPPGKDYHNDIYDIDEHTVLIFDWAHKMGTDMFLAHHHADGDNKAPNILINGLGRYKSITKENNVTENIPYSTFLVKKNLRYRFRLINAEFLNCPIEISIDNHTLQLISSDGRDVERVEADSFVSYAGERFDFIVEANQPVDNYWIRFRGLMDCDERFLSAHQAAILRYEGAPEQDPRAKIFYNYKPENITDIRINALNEGTETNNSLSIPLLNATDNNDESYTKEADYQFYISYDFYDKDNSHFHRKNIYSFYQVKDKRQRVFTPQLNHISNKLPHFPLFSQREMIDSSQFCNSSSVKGCKDEHCSCTHALQIKYGSIVELILVDEGVTYDANHPFHLHGYQFRVIAMERLGRNVTVDEIKRLDAKGMIKRKLNRAPLKDTVTVPDGGYTIIRFHADNPGYWLFHCHIEFHAEIGMSLVFKVGDHEEMVAVPRNFPKCGDYASGISLNHVTDLPVVPTTKKYDLTENEIDRRFKLSIEKLLPLISEALHHSSSSSNIYTQFYLCFSCFIFILSNTYL
ncbi:uncharacterized protein [Prorops nasuta]